MKVIVLVRHSPGVLMALIAVLATILGPPLAPPVGAIEFGCRIGKPSYCFKYGQTFCRKDNVLPDREQACADWTAACLDCHGFIPKCLGGTRPPTASPLCRACESEWRSCMHVIDDAFWPNRRRKSPDAAN